MSVITFTSSADFIEALEARREFWREHDERAKAEHQVKEDEFLESFRAACRAALGWDYATAKDNYFKLPRTDDFDTRRGPTCPRRVETSIDRLVSLLRTTSQKRFTLERTGRWSDAYSLLVDDPSSPQDVC